MRRPSIAFLFLGGAHQVLHIALVALELEQFDVATVRFLAAGEAERFAVIDLWRKLGLAEPNVELLPLPRWAEMLAQTKSEWSDAKLLKVIAARSLLASFDAVVVAERTCTILKRIPGRKPILIHVPHGAGDRAKGFERRIRLFDHIIVAGEKDRSRLIVEGICNADKVSVSGYIKLATVNRLRARSKAASIFDNDKPTVIYNPHFATRLGSWSKFSDVLITAFARQGQFNLIVAPHVRLFQNASPDERHAVEARAIPGSIHIDLGSPLSNDMTYTLAADVYVGDVSSQVYEFLQIPKPCVFLNAGTANWQSDQSFGFWHLGEVVTDPAEVIASVERASDLHARFAALQIRARELALGPIVPCPGITAARVIAKLAKNLCSAPQTIP